VVKLVVNSRLVTLVPKLTVTLAVFVFKLVPGATTVPPWQVSTMSPTSSVKPSARNTGGTATDGVALERAGTRVAVQYLRAGKPREEGQHS